jgi:ribosome assembly protein SQT1
MTPYQDPGDMHDEDGGNQFINDEDILAVVPDDGDHPMDDDEDDEANDMVRDLTHPIEGTEDTSLRQFLGHIGSVFCVSSHPTAPIAVSGGEDDLGYIWNINDGERIVTLTGHTDSITTAAFSTDGEMVATGGMDGKVRVWRRVGQENWKTWEFLTELQGADEVIVNILCVCTDANLIHISSGSVGIQKAPYCWLARTMQPFGFGSVSTLPSYLTSLIYIILSSTIW